MADREKLNLDDPVAIPEEEDDEVLAAIDQGIRDADEGRVVPIEEVRKLLPKWIHTASSSRKER